MTQAIPVYIVNLARRPERLARLGGQLDGLGIRWQRIDALDALEAGKAELDAVIAADGPLGRLGDADRACTISHMRAWAALSRRLGLAGSSRFTAPRWITHWARSHAPSGNNCGVRHATRPARCACRA